MKKRILILIVLMATLATLAGSAGAASAPTTFYYGDITLPSGGGSYLQPGTWDLNACPVTVSYTLDLSGAPNVAYTGNYGQSGYVGLVWPGSPWAGAWMSGYLADGDNAGTEFPMYPDNDNSQDLDDKFNMQRSPYPGSWSETMYDVYCDINTVAASPFGSWSNYGIWFDRDGVDPYQPNYWGMVDGGTYNTWGVYDVQITYDWSANYPTSKGTACATFFPTLQNDDAPGGYGIPTGFNRLSPGPGYADIPAGISFDTDESKMASMRALVFGNSGNGTIVVRDLTVTGCLALEEGMATGGGWFIPDDDNAVGLTNLGGKATFGFVAKQDDKKGSSGHLEFQYHADNLNLKSTSYDWVNVSSTQAMFEGVGTINDMGSYRFRVRAVDGDKLGNGTDRFEIRIWTGNGDTWDMPTYRAEGDLGGGQIVVHKK
jgi:hypothetical protein